MNRALGELPATAAGADIRLRRLRVLVLDEYFPFPPDSGKPIRTWNLLRRLAARHDITLLCHGHLTADQATAAHEAGIKVESVDAIPQEAGLALYGRLLVNLASRYPYSVTKHHTARFGKKLREVLAAGKFDILHCEWTPYARYLSGVDIPSLIATHNIESQIWHAGRSAPLILWPNSFFVGRQSRWSGLNTARCPQPPGLRASAPLMPNKPRRGAQSRPGWWTMASI